MRKKRKRQSGGKLIILVVAMIMVNLLGVSYAYWSDNLNMDVSMSTGYIEPYFISDDIAISDDSEGEITASIIDNDTIEITGWCYPGFQKNISLKLGNSGTIPVIYKGVDGIEEDEQIMEDIQYEGSRNRLIGAEDEEEINIQIHTKKQAQYKDHTFYYQVQFEQGIR